MYRCDALLGLLASEVAEGRRFVSPARNKDSVIDLLPAFKYLLGKLPTVFQAASFDYLSLDQPLRSFHV